MPYGLTSQWTDSFPGRFLAQGGVAPDLYVQPNFAYQVNDKWSVGAGPVFGHSSVELIQALDLVRAGAVRDVNATSAHLGIPQRTEFARATLEG